MLPVIENEILDRQALELGVLEGLVVALMLGNVANLVQKGVGAFQESCVKHQFKIKLESVKA